MCSSFLQFCPFPPAPLLVGSPLIVKFSCYKLLGSAGLKSRSQVTGYRSQVKTKTLVNLWWVRILYSSLLTWWHRLICLRFLVWDFNVLEIRIYQKFLSSNNALPIFHLVVTYRSPKALISTLPWKALSQEITWLKIKHMVAKMADYEVSCRFRFVIYRILSFYCHFLPT